MLLRPKRRLAVTSVESAFVLPITLLLLLGLMVGAAGILRYQEVANLARRAARYAIVHGTQYATDQKVTAPTPADIYNSQILPYAVGMNANKLSYAITYNSSNAPYTTGTSNGEVIRTANTVSVTVSYQWVPEAFGTSVSLSSTSVMVMSY